MGLGQYPAYEYQVENITIRTCVLYFLDCYHTSLNPSLVLDSFGTHVTIVMHHDFIVLIIKTQI